MIMRVLDKKVDFSQLQIVTSYILKLSGSKSESNSVWKMDAVEISFIITIKKMSVPIYL